MYYISNKILQKMIEKNLIENDEVEIYEYGIQLFFLKIIHLCSIFIVGFILGIPIEIAIFIICYSLLRSYTGGYHAQSALYCLLISINMVICMSFTIQYINKTITLLICIMNVISILKLSPAINKDMIVDGEDIIENRNKSIIVSIISFVIFIILFILQIKTLYMPIFYSLFFCSLFLIIAKLNIREG